MSAGLRVLRGPDWPGDDDRDGGEGHLGTVVSVGGEGTCEVLWDNGDRKLCRIGKFGKHDLRIFDNAPIGVRHPQIVCDGCESRGIAGMLWKCAQCRQCNLCSVCYVTDKHDLGHEFFRHDTPESSGVKVKRRSSSLKIRAMGLFPGATVVRGTDWNSGNMDGGPGKTGQLAGVINNSSAPSTRNMVKVKWSSGQQGEHRVGHQGKVDIKYKEESPGTYYYKEHLPCLNADDAHHTTSRELEILQEGDKVCIQVPASSLKSMQSDRSGWTSGMTNCIGKIGVIKSFTPSGDATVEFGGLRFRFFPGALKKVPDLNVGDVVEIQNDEEKVKMLQEGHVQWTPDMKQLLGKCGKVVKVGEDGNVVVAFGKSTFLFFSGCCTVKHGGRVHEMADVPDSPRSPSESSTDVHGDLLKLMAAVMMKDRLQKMATVVDPDMLYQAIGNGDVSMVKSIVNKAPKLLDVNHKGVTPLILAAHEGQTDVVRALLDLGAQTTPTDAKGHTALHAALIGRKEKTAQLLLERGASAQPSNNVKRTSLHFAAHANLFGIMPDLIRKGCNVNSRDLAGDTPLHDAITKGNKEAIVIMLRAAKIDLAVPNNKGFNPLQLTCLIGNAFATEAILKRDTSTVNMQRQEDRFAAIHIAAANDHVDCAKILTDTGKAKVDLQGGNNYTALHLACEEGYFRTTELLLEKGADPNLKDVEGNTALHLAITGDKQRSLGEQQMLAALLGLTSRNDDETRVKLACLLLHKNAILDARNNSGQTPLDCARSQTVKQAILMFVRQNELSIRRSSVPTQTGGTRVRLGAGLLDMELPCAKCMCKMAEVTILPCGHKILCRQCCLVTEICPVCDTHIQRRTVKRERTERVDLEEVCKQQ